MRRRLFHFDCEVQPMPKKTNILVFMTDQQLGDTIDPKHLAKTPNVDRLAAQGVRFDQSYCCAPHCCPSRATFFTGQYPSQHNIWNNVEVDSALSRGFYDGVETFVPALQDAGYRTIFSGKWHVHGYQGPLDHGFDEVLCEKGTNYGRKAPENRPMCATWNRILSGIPLDGADSEKDFGRIVRPGYPTYHQFSTDPNPFGDADTVDMACDRLKTMDQTNPFFMYVGTIGPHDPYNPPQAFLDLYNIDDIELPPTFHDDMEGMPELYRRTRDAFALTEAEHKESMRRYLAFVSYEDYLFGKVLDTLEETGQMENTLVVYMTDHGDYLGAHGLWAKGLPCYREAYQICSVIGGAGVTAQGTVNHQLVSIADFAPTFLDVAGATSQQPIIGRSLRPFLTGDSDPNWRTELFTQTNGNELYGIQRAVWNKKWKYVYNGFAGDILFDLEADPLELHNVIDDPANKAVVYQMWRHLWQFSRQTGDMATSPYIMVALAPYGPGIVLDAPPLPLQCKGWGS